MKKIFFIILLINISITAQTNHLLQKVDSLLYQGNYTLALTELNNINPQTFETFNRKGNIYKQIGNYSKAIIEYQLALSKYQDLKTKENLGRCYQNSNNSAKAIELFNEVLKINPNNTLLKYHLAKLFRLKREHNKAKQLFKELIITDNTNPNYYNYLGMSHLSLSEKDSAKVALLNVIKLDSTHFKGNYYLAKVFRKKDKYKKYRLLSKMPKINNDTSYYYLNKGLEYYPKNKSFNLLAVDYYFEDKDYKKTIELLNNVENLKTEQKQLLGISYYYTKNFEKAKDYFYELLNSRQQDSKDAYYMALVYKAEKDFEKAELYINLSIEIEQPKLSSHYYELGLIHQGAKQYQKAINSFKISLKENKYNDKAQYQLALTCDSYYKDITITIKHYETYLKRFKRRDKQTYEFVKQRLAELKQKDFMAVD